MPRLAEIDPKQNHLLGAIPATEWARFAPHLTPVALELGDVIYEAGTDQPYVYFPTTSIVSLLNVMKDGSSAEIAIVGNEGLIGISLLMGGDCGAHTFPYIETRNPSATVEHEASTSKISEEQLFYCLQRGIDAEDAVNMIVSGFCKTVLKELPMEFAVEAQNLLAVSLEGAVG